MRSSLYPVGSACMLNLTSEGLSPYCSVNQNIHISGRAKYQFLVILSLTLYLIEMPINTFANRADSDQAALIRAA